MYLAHDVDAVDDERAVARHPQRDVQRRPILGGVDVLAAKHRVAVSLDLSRSRDGDEQSYRLLGDAVFREVCMDAGRLEGESFDARGVGGEELAQMGLPHVRVMTAERLPGGGVDEGVGHLVRGPRSGPGRRLD